MPTPAEFTQEIIVAVRNYTDGFIGQDNHTLDLDVRDPSRVSQARVRRNAGARVILEVDEIIPGPSQQIPAPTKTNIFEFSPGEAIAAALSASADLTVTSGAITDMTPITIYHIDSGIRREITIRENLLQIMVDEAIKRAPLVQQEVLYATKAAISDIRTNMRGWFNQRRGGSLAKVPYIEQIGARIPALKTP